MISQQITLVAHKTQLCNVMRNQTMVTRWVNAQTVAQMLGTHNQQIGTVYMRNCIVRMVGTHRQLTTLGTYKPHTTQLLGTISHRTCANRALCKCWALPCLALPCPALPYLALPWPALACLGLPWPALAYPGLP